MWYAPVNGKLISMVYTNVWLWYKYGMWYVPVHDYKISMVFTCLIG